MLFKELSLAHACLTKCSYSRNFRPYACTFLSLVGICRIQSSQNEAGHLGRGSYHNVFFSIHPRSGKNSQDKANHSRVHSFLPLSFHADTHQRVGSFSNNDLVASKYSKKSGATSRSSSTMIMVSYCMISNACVKAHL